MTLTTARQTTKYNSNLERDRDKETETKRQRQRDRDKETERERARKENEKDKQKNDYYKVQKNIIRSSAWISINHCTNRPNARHSNTANARFWKQVNHLSLCIKMEKECFDSKVNFFSTLVHAGFENGKKSII
uniref:Uncharacterized protein n=1 Tax=Amphimedon queenslandica TaxID=400682 RepID=A0A1X7UY14_AMPQE